MTAAAADDAAPRDDLVTLVAIGLLAYATADIAHHVLGHGATCLALGGRIVLLSSIFVDCTVRGSAIDRPGPIWLGLGCACACLSSVGDLVRAIVFRPDRGLQPFLVHPLASVQRVRRAPTISPGRWRRSTCRSRCAMGCRSGRPVLRAVGSCRGEADGRLRPAAGARVADRRDGVADGGRVRLRDRFVRSPSGRRDPSSRRAAIPHPVDRPAVPAATRGADIDGRLVHNRIFDPLGRGRCHRRRRVDGVPGARIFAMTLASPPAPRTSRVSGADPSRQRYSQTMVAPASAVISATS